jgi:hypothetical protein
LHAQISVSADGDVPLPAEDYKKFLMLGGRK